MSVAKSSVTLSPLKGFAQQLGRLMRWLAHRWAPIIGSVILLGLAVLGVVVGIQPDKFGWILSTALGHWLTVGLVVVALVVQIVSLVDTDSVAELKTDLQSAQAATTLANRERDIAVKDLRDYFEANLRQLSDRLGFRADERISVYEYSDDGFTLIGRYSLNKERRRKGRATYPFDQGVVGRAWDGQLAFVDDLPDPNLQIDQYCTEVQTRFNMPVEVVRGLRMKSRTLSAHVILDALNDGPVAVIVFESIRSAAFTEDIVATALLGDETRIKYYLEQRRPQPGRG